MRVRDRLSHAWKVFVQYASGEFLLLGPIRRPNGGAVTLLRSLIVTGLIYLPAVILSEVLAPTSVWRFSPEHAAAAIRSTIPWLGAIFGAVYALMYSKFSSQWTYLAGLYNQIKATEAQIAASAEPDGAREVIASWKAGFIEDADDLHLAAKPMYAAVIRNWASNPDVQREFAKHAPGGATRLAEIQNLVDFVYRIQDKPYHRIQAPPSSDSER